MKIALCFYGMVGSKTNKDGKGETLNPEIAYNLNFDNIIIENNVDVFIHSWSTDCKEKLKALYDPKLYIIEEQINFKKESKRIVNNRDLTEKLKIIGGIIKGKNSFVDNIERNKREAFRAYSRWYSNKKVLDLKSQYEEENGFKYDCVMVLRLDVGFYKKMDFSKYNMKYFYASNWNDYPNENNKYSLNYVNNHQGKGFLDFWFFSNSDNMNKFSLLYDNIEKYHVCPHRSSFEHVKSFTKYIRYIKYRWTDFEMIRRKKFDSER